MGNGRPVTDTPEYVGELFYIEIPNPKDESMWVIHKMSTDVNSHQTHIDAMISHGIHNFRERREVRLSQI